MMDTATSTNRHRWFLSFAIGIGFALFLAFVGYLVVALHSLKTLQEQFTTLRGEQEELKRELQWQERNANYRFELLEQETFGATTKPPNQASIQLWQKNRDKELRDRIKRLEAWRQGWEVPQPEDWRK